MLGLILIKSAKIYTENAIDNIDILNYDVIKSTLH
jgi:hypothetical protein